MPVIVVEANSYLLEVTKLSADNILPMIEMVIDLWPDCSRDEELINYRSLIDSEVAQCFLVRNNTDYLAFIHVDIRNDYVEGSSGSPIAYVEGIYVKPGYRKQGIGQLLMRAAEDWARHKGFHQIASDTEVANDGSIQFHRKSGFSESTIVCFVKDIGNHTKS